MHGISFDMMIQPIRHRRPTGPEGLSTEFAEQADRFEVEAWLGRPLRASHDRPAGAPPARGPEALPDLIPGLLAEDARRGRHEGWIGGGLAALFLGAVFMGWALPMLAAAFVAAPFVAAFMEWQDSRRAA